MLVINGVELVLVNEPLKVGELERDHTIRGQQMHHSCSEIVEIRDLRQHVVTNDEVGSLTLGHELLCELQAEKLDNSRNILPPRGFRHIGGRLNANYGNTQWQEVLKQITVVACDLEYLALRTKIEPGLHHFAIPARMLDPGGRVRRKICVFVEDVFRLHIFLQLHQETPVTHENVQWKVRLHPIKLVSGQIAFAKGRHPEIDKGRLKWRLAQPAI